MIYILFAGGTPFAEISSGDLYQQLCNGMRLPCPLHCAQEVYDIMKACWEGLPTRRLPFYQLEASLEALANVVSELGRKGGVRGGRRGERREEG